MRSIEHSNARMCAQLRPDRREVTCRYAQLRAVGRLGTPRLTRSLVSSYAQMCTQLSAQLCTQLGAHLRVVTCSYSQLRSDGRAVARRLARSNAQMGAQFGAQLRPGGRAVMQRYPHLRVVGSVVTLSYSQLLAVTRSYAQLRAVTRSYARLRAVTRGYAQLGAQLRPDVLAVGSAVSITWTRSYA